MPATGFCRYLPLITSFSLFAPRTLVSPQQPTGYWRALSLYYASFGRFRLLFDAQHYYDMIRGFIISIYISAFCDIHYDTTRRQVLLHTFSLQALSAEKRYRRRRMPGISSARRPHRRSRMNYSARYDNTHFSRYYAHGRMRLGRTSALSRIDDMEWLK